MANTKSSEKRNRQSVKRRARSGVPAVAELDDAIGRAGLRTIAVNHAAILHIGPRADHDPGDIPAQHAVVPDRRIWPDFDIADDPAARSDKGAVMDSRAFAVDADDRGVGMGSGHGFPKKLRQVT